MQTQVRFIFKAEGKDYPILYNQPSSPQLLAKWISVQKGKLEAELHTEHLRAFVRKESPHQAYQYIKLTSKQFLDINNQHDITVEFFFNSRKESIASELNKIGMDLELRENQLKLMVNELKDEASQMYAMEIISKTSRSYSVDVEHAIDIILVVSDPLVHFHSDEAHPIYNDEVNITSHIERLKRASMSDSNLTIRAKREWATKKRLVSILSQEEVSRKKINIVELLTEVRRMEGKLMLSLEGPLGEQIWESAEEILSYHEIDLLIIIGVGANLLSEINYAKPLLLITSISIEEKRIITQSRNMMDSENIYNDAFSQVFLENFYQSLFKRAEIGESVDVAKREAGKLIESYIWCCCMHEHAPNCGWEEIINKIGYMEAHRLFKHNEYKVNNYYSTTFEIQKFLLNGQETCCGGNICCFERQGLSKLVLHRQVNKILHWNQKCSEVLYSNFDDNEKRLNKFETEEYDKPSGRKRPLTIYKLLQAIVEEDQQVLIIRSPTLSLAKRYLSFAKEYLQARNREAFFFEYIISKESSINKYLKDVISLLKSRAKLGASTTLRIDLFIEVSHNLEKLDKYYLKLFNDEPNEVLSEAKALGLEIERVKFILLTCHPNFDDRFPCFKIDDPEKSELYHYHFSKYSYDYIRNNLESIKSEIRREETVKDQQIQQICDEILFQRHSEYLFLGFISLFNEDGFYLTKYGRIVLENLFGDEVVNKAIDHTLPIELINLSDCIYVQLHKAYQKHFLHPSNAYRQEFQKKQLEYYFILLRTYCELTSASDLTYCEGALRLMARQEGLFSINILQESDAYDEVVQRCKETLKSVSNQSALLDHNSFRHLYHLNQMEKIIQNFMKRKKNQYVATSKSIVRQTEPFLLTYLFWNNIHLSWKLLLAATPHFPDKVAHFQTTLLNFLARMEITSPFAEIARLQIYMMIGRIPPKSEEIKQSKEPSIKDLPNEQHGLAMRMGSSVLRQMEQSSVMRNQLYGGLKCSKEMSQLLNFLRMYSVRQYNLSKVELEWGQLHKLQEEINPCIKFAEKIINLLQGQHMEFREELEDHRMFRNFSILAWEREILKFIERKIIYYFQLTRMLKQMQPKEARFSRENEFFRQLKLAHLVSDFRAQCKKMPLEERTLPHRLLIDHYLKVLTNECEVDPALIEQMKGKISAEFLPLFDHLCQKIGQNTLFNQEGLIICARARTILSQGRPYIMSRKRNLTMLYLKENIQKLNLKISYFTLNTNTLNNLTSQEHNKCCEVLFLILTVDCPSAKQLSFGEDAGINAEPMDVGKFAEQISECRINVLVICGKNSIKMCEQLVALAGKWEYFPALIALQNHKYNICDEPYHHYDPTASHSDRAWQFLCNEVGQMAFDLLAISIVANISSRLTHRAHVPSKQELEEKVTRSLKMVHQVLSQHFECASEVLAEMDFRVWASGRTIDRILPGTLQDLTAKFYSSEHNLHDQNYYQNVGRCAEVNQVMEGIVKTGQRCIEIIGRCGTGKSTLLQEICWISQTKSLFKFGVFLFRLNEDKDNSMINFEDFFRNREFKSCQNFKTNQTSVLIALDNVDDNFLSSQLALLKGLRGKSVTIIYTTSRREVGEALQAVLDCKQCLSVNLNKVTLDQVYGLLMSHIKLYNSTEDHRYSKKIVAEFERKVDAIMKVIERVEDELKISKALELLKDINPRKDDKVNLFLHFYKKNFDRLNNLLQNIKQIKVKIV